VQLTTLARGRDQRHPLHVLAEAAVAVVVLAVHVARDRAAHRHLSRPRRDRQEPAERQHRRRQPVERYARLHRDRAALHVERQQPVQPGRVDHEAAGVLGGVAVRPAEPACDGTPRPSGGKRSDHLVAVRR
jgi:hypothetical protein